MMQWARRKAMASLPAAAIVAMALLLPNVGATTKHHAAKHQVSKHSLPPHSSRRAKHVSATRHLSEQVPNHRAPRRKIRHTRLRLPSGPSSDRIGQIQQALARSGYYQGDPSGKWDSSTVDAMKQFQQAHGITPSGKIDAPSLQQLGLGSDVAGVAPPEAVVPAGLVSANKGNKSGGRDR